MALIITCAYCHHDCEFTGDWHSCPEAQAAKRSLQTLVSGIRADILNPSQRRLTEADKQRREAMRGHVAGVSHIRGFALKPEYQMNGNN